MSDEKIERVLEQVDPDKREFLKKVVIASAFTVPVVASFSMEGLAPNEAFAQVNSANGG